MKFCIIFSCLCLVTHHVYTAFTEKQMNATKKLVRNTCQNKVKVSPEEIDAMQKGDFGISKNQQCYLACILGTYKLLSKDNTFDWEGGIKAMHANAPPNIAEPGSVSIKNCKDAVKTTGDKCVAAMEVAMCIYNDNPANYFLP